MQKECQILSEVADEMARAGYPLLHAVGMKTRVDGNRVKTYLSRCLKALRPESVTPDALTVKQAADRLNVSPSKVYKLCESGQLHCFKIGRATRIAVADIDTLKEKPRRFSHFRLNG
jgi:excisionase family DNA binding protein